MVDAIVRPEITEVVMNSTEALARLESAPIDSLAEWAYESHKDFYGVKGRHMSNWTHAELLSWIKSHFEWDDERQAWTNSVPFCD